MEALKTDGLSKHEEETILHICTCIRDMDNLERDYILEIAEDMAKKKLRFQAYSGLMDIPPKVTG